MEQRGFSTKVNPLGPALVAGLTWGFLFGLWDNRASLVQKNLFRFLGPRLLGTAYTTLLYSLFFALLLLPIGLLTWGVLVLVRRPVSRAALVAGYLGGCLGVTTAAFWLTSYEDLLNPSGVTAEWVARWVLASAGEVLLSGLVGLSLHAWFRWLQRRRRWLHWVSFRNTVLTTAGSILLLLLLVAGHRAFLRDITLLRPRSGGQVATPERPNILLITIDTLRADHLGAYGYDPEISPHIDALARRGVLFEQAIAQSSWTLQSVASFLTSIYPTELQVYCARGGPVCSTILDGMRTTIAEAVKEGGYRTQAYLNNVWLQPDRGFLQGFDDARWFRDQEPFDLESLRERPLLELVGRHSEPFRELFAQGHKLLFDPGFLQIQEGASISEYAVRFLKKHREERFFLWLYYMEPHTPYQPVRPYRPLPQSISPERETFLRNMTFWPLGSSGPSVLTPADLQALVSLYDGEVHDVDWQVGQVLQQLDKLGLTDRTLVVLLADHGEEFNDHGGYTHGRALYQETVRVPLIFSGPPVAQPGRVVETPVALLDLLPTLAEVAGVPIPADARGRSLLPALRGEELAEVPIYTEGLHRMPVDSQALIYQGYKLIYSSLQQKVELYDLRNDPGEQVNLVETDRSRADEMLALLQAWMEQSHQVAQTLPRESPPRTTDEWFIRLLEVVGY